MQSRLELPLASSPLASDRGVTLAAIRRCVAAGPTVVAAIAKAQGSTPREVGAFMIVTEDATVGSVGGGEAELRTIEAARDMLVAGLCEKSLSLPLGPSLDQCCGGKLTITLARLDEPPEGPFQLSEHGPLIADRALAPVVLYGAGHVGISLARALAPLPFALTIIEARAESLWPVPADLSVTRSAIPETAVAAASDDAIHVVMTHSHALDLEIVAAALARPFRFLGLIGSLTKRATFERRLEERGLDYSRLTSPIGLPSVKGKAPAVIAASVAAQLLSLPEG